jgi:hypothetical protein
METEDCHVADAISGVGGLAQVGILKYGPFSRGGPFPTTFSALTNTGMT